MHRGLDGKLGDNRITVRAADMGLKTSKLAFVLLSKSVDKIHHERKDLEVIKSSQRERPKKPELQPRLRVLLSGEIALGPGKAELLGYIAETGSISEAASRIGMSYMRAWTLVQTMNACFREPLVVAARGGKERGGASVTPSGRKALELYRRMEEQSSAAVEATWTQLRALLKA